MFQEFSFSRWAAVLVVAMTVYLMANSCNDSLQAEVKAAYDTQHPPDP